jgi:hypothetical protein
MSKPSQKTNLKQALDPNFENHFNDDIALRKYVDASFAEEGIDLSKIYAERRLDQVYKGVFKRLRTTHRAHRSSAEAEQKVGKSLAKIKEIFQERKDLQEQAENVFRQVKEIEQFSKNPAKIDVTHFLKQLHEHQPWHNGNPNFRGWNVDRDGFGDETGDNSKSWRGGSDEETNAILNRRNPIYHTTQPLSSYQNNVFDSRTIALENIRVNEARLDIFLREGREITVQEEKRLQLRDRTKHIASNVTESLLHSAYKTGGPLLKGIAYDSKAEEGRYFKRQMRRNYKTLSDLMYKVGPNYLDGAFYIKHLESLNEQLKNSDDPYEVDLYYRMKQILTQRSDALKKQVKKDMEDFQKSVDGVTEKFDEKAKEYTKEEDEAFKWQILCALTLIAPFAPAVAGIGSLNIMAPIMDIFGPVFFGSNGFSSSLAGVTNSLGPFSFLAEVMKVPYALEWLGNNTPFVNVIIGNDGLMQLLTRNDIAQNLFGVLSPLGESPLPLIALGLTAATVRGAIDFEHYKGKWDFAKANQGEFEKVTDNFVKTRQGNLENIINGVTDKNGNQTTTSIASDSMEQKKAAFIFGKTVKLIAKLDKESLKIFDDILLFKTGLNPDKGETLSSLKERLGTISAGDIARLFKQNSDSRGPEFNQGEILRRAVILDHVKSQALSPEDTINQFSFIRSSQPHSQAVMSNFAKKAEIELIEMEAKKSKLSNSVFEKDPQKRASALEQKIIAADKEKLRGLMFDQIPDGSITPESHSQIMDQSHHQVSALG